MIEFSIVIPTFNRANITKSCIFLLLKLLENSKFDFEIIVVNDGSTDETETFFKNLSATNNKVRLINTDKKSGEYRNPGFARNAGIKASKGKYVCFSDGDILHLIDPTLDTKKIFDENDGNCYITGIHYRYMNNALQGPRGVGADMPHGSWLAVSKEKLISIGGYDQRFKRYGNEDHDIVQRLRRLGIKHVSSTNIVALHPEFDSGRPSSNLDNIAKDLQMEIQRDPSVIRNQGVEWGRYTEVKDGSSQLNPLPVARLQEGLKIEAFSNAISSISDSLTILASSARKIDVMSNMTRSMHAGYVSLENPLFQRKKHSSKEKEILKLYKLSDSTRIATDSKEIKSYYDDAKFLNELDGGKNCVDFLILNEMHRQRNLGTYLDRAYDLLSSKGVCIILCPAYSNNVGSGNTNSLWNAGYIIYNLIMAGFDCKNSKVSTFEGEIQLSASKTHRRAKSFSISDCFDYFPFDVYQHFNGNIKELNWFPVVVNQP
jgi:glycosyltransferase involved in cell wall biosynthesis